MLFYSLPEERAQYSSLHLMTGLIWRLRANNCVGITGAKNTFSLPRLWLQQTQDTKNKHVFLHVDVWKFQCANCYCWCQRRAVSGSSKARGFERKAENHILTIRQWNCFNPASDTLGPTKTIRVQRANQAIQPWDVKWRVTFPQEEAVKLTIAAFPWPLERREGSRRMRF